MKKSLALAGLALMAAVASTFIVPSLAWARPTNAWNFKTLLLQSDQTLTVQGPANFTGAVTMNAGSLSAASLAAGSIDTTKIAPGAVDTGKLLLGGTIDTTKIVCTSPALLPRFGFYNALKQTCDAVGSLTGI